VLECRASGEIQAKTDKGMLFNSLRFFVFFPIVAALYFAIPHRFRWFLLLVASYYFYMCWRVRYAVLLVISTLIDYFAGLILTKATSRRVRLLCLVLSLGANLTLLFVFKYYNFFTHAFESVLSSCGMNVALPASAFLLPVGISFYTLQSMSYTIDVYCGRQPVERHPGIFGLYVVFFPQLVAGPIERAPNLLPQLKLEHRFDYDRVTNGLKLILWGLFKKTVIADRLGMLVTPVYDNPAAFDGLILTVATVFFAFQVYCDFSGYSDIAIGTAEVFGVKLMQNFRRPFFARSIAELWQRWHISLTSWFRDYVYIPLGGNRVPQWRWYFNVIVVFLLSGLWHGANWTFLIWGGLHGFFVLAGSVLRPLRTRLVSWIRLDRLLGTLHVLQVLTTFSLFCLALVFFRAKSLSTAGAVLARLFHHWRVPLSIEALQRIGPKLNLQADFFVKELALSVLFIAFLVCVQMVQERGSIRQRLARQPVWVRFGVYSAGLWVLFLFGVFQQKEFIYFTF